jgi:hypothetical protein
MSQRLVDHGDLARREPVVREGDRVLIAAVGEHLDRTFGPGFVIHDRDSRWVHVDVFVYPATETRSYTVLATCGMAERPLTTCQHERVWTELLVCLPDDWPVTSAALADPALSWPVSLLRWIARMPHQTGTGFAKRESMGPIPYAQPAQRPYPYDGAVFLGQRLVPRLGMVGREIEFLAVCLIHGDELAWIRARGVDVLLEAFAANEDSPLLVDDDRPSYAPG